MSHSGSWTKYVIIMLWFFSIFRQILYTCQAIVGNVFISYFYCNYKVPIQQIRSCFVEIWSILRKSIYAFIHIRVHRHPESSKTCHPTLKGPPPAARHFALVSNIIIIAKIHSLVIKAENYVFQIMDITTVVFNKSTVNSLATEIHERNSKYVFFFQRHFSDHW